MSIIGNPVFSSAVGGSNKPIYLIKDGRQQIGFIKSGGLLRYNSGGYADFDSAGNAVRLIYPSQLIDITKYDSLNIILKRAGQSWTATGVPSIGLFLSMPQVDASSGAFTDYANYQGISASNLSKQTLDISSLNGLYYIVAVVSGTGSWGGHLYIQDFWLE